jgi:hypothetical protein
MSINRHTVPDRLSAANCISFHAISQQAFCCIRCTALKKLQRMRLMQRKLANHKGKRAYVIRCTHAARKGAVGSVRITQANVLQ